MSRGNLRSDRIFAFQSTRLRGTISGWIDRKFRLTDCRTSSSPGSNTACGVPARPSGSRGVSRLWDDQPSRIRGVTIMGRLSTSFPFIDYDQLLRHPKARKPMDLNRILRSRQSEDWVTWNVLRAIQRRSSWWPALVSFAKGQAIGLDDCLTAGRPPAVDFWRLVPTPPAYERVSRERMKGSDRPAWRRRADNPRLVEGPTEVDIVFDGVEFLVFVEAKLCSDVCEGTTYDPLRNQIVRNVDCAIEAAGDRQPVFWMFVKDRKPDRRYSEIIDYYRTNVGLLESQLPHRDRRVLTRIAKNIAVVEWRELMPLLPDTPDLGDLVTEIRSRVE